MKSFQVVIVTILFMALLMTSDAHKRKCQKRLKKVRQKFEECETELQNVTALNNDLQNENAECEIERQKVEELNNELQNETAELKKELEECKKTPPPPPPPECQNYQILSNGDRKNTYISAYTAGNRVGCDDNLGPAWFRFQGDAGTQMATSCLKINRCGTHAPGWLNGAHPTVDQGQVTRQACFRYWNNCCQWSINILVRNCGDFYIYYINKTPPEHKCHLRYCGSD